MRLKRYQAEHRNGIEGAVLTCVHDLKAPLGNIFKILQLLELDTGLGDHKQVKQSYDLIYKNIHFMNDLVKRLSDYICLEKDTPNCERVDINNVFQDACDLLKSQIHDNEATITCDKLPTLYGDHGQLTQLFQNLMANALHYKADERPIAIHVSCQTEDKNHVFCVADNGIGIPAKYKNKIFNLFERGEQGITKAGSGIGLAICKQVVEQHGGQIWLESKVGQGSKFYFSIPKKRYN